MNEGIKSAIAPLTRIAPNHSEGWTPSQVSPTQLGSEMDDAMDNLKDTAGAINVAVQLPDGAGAFNQMMRVKNPKRYEVPFVAIQMPPVDSMVVANGTRKKLDLGKTWYPEQALDEPTKVAISSPSEMAKQWHYEFPHLIFQGITDHKPAFAPVIGEWARGQGGYAVKVEERHIPFTSQINHKTYDEVDYRILADRTPDAAKTQGASSIEIVLDKFHHLPVTIRENWSDPTGSKKYSVMWTCSYAFRQKFTAKDFPSPFKK